MPDDGFRNDMVRRKEDEQGIKASPSTAAGSRLESKPQVQSLAEYQRARGSPPISNSSMQASSSSKPSSDYDSFARQEYFANRAAAAAVKAKIEMNLGASVATPNVGTMSQQQSGTVATRVGGPIQQPIRRGSPTMSEYDDPEQRIAAIKAQKEREKQQQLEEKQRQLEAAAAEYRQQRKLIEAKRALESNSQAVSSSHESANRSPGVAFSISFDDDKSPQPIQPVADAKDHRVSPAPRDSKAGMNSLPPKQPDRTDEISPSASNAAGRKGWSKPAPGESMVLSPLGVVSLPSSSSTTTTSSSKAEDGNEREVLNRVASRNQNRVQARQQAKVILRRLRDQKQREPSSLQSGVRKPSPSDTRVHDVLSSIQRAKESVEKAKASRSTSSSRNPKQSSSEATAINIAASDEMLEETLNKWLQINEDRSSSNEIIDDITAVVVDNNLSHALKSTSTAKEVEEDADLIIHEASPHDEVAYLQCELAKALMNIDDN
jgi:hypothetical protein